MIFNYYCDGPFGLNKRRYKRVRTVRRRPEEPGEVETTHPLWQPLKQGEGRKLKKIVMASLWFMALGSYMLEKHILYMHLPISKYSYILGIRKYATLRASVGSGSDSYRLVPKSKHVWCRNPLVCYDSQLNNWLNSAMP